MNAEQEICCVMKNVIDCLIAEMSGRFFRPQELHSQIGFLPNVSNIITGHFENGKSSQVARKMFWFNK